MMSEIYDFQTEAAGARGRARLCGFLNLPFVAPFNTQMLAAYRIPEAAAILEALVEKSADSDMAAGAECMLAYLRNTAADDPLQVAETLGIDQTRLFRGISPEYGPPPPYEAVWSQGENETASIQSLAEIYRQAGLEPADERPERPDYIGMQLEFLSTLALGEATAWEKQDGETALSLRLQQAGFLSQHLGVWGPAFIDKALAMARSAFFRGHLLVLRGFLAEECDELAAPV